jgi:hypothetical protein
MPDSAAAARLCLEEAPAGFRRGCAGHSPAGPGVIRTSFVLDRAAPTNLVICCPLNGFPPGFFRTAPLRRVTLAEACC